MRCSLSLSMAVFALSSLAPVGACFTGKTLRILPLGASITLGIGSSNLSGYRETLLDSLRKDLNTVSVVGTQRNGTMKCPDDFNEGHPGFQIDAVEGVLKSTQVLTRFKPNVVLLLVGTNDMIFNTDEQVAQAPARLGKLMDKIFTDCPTCTLMLSNIPPQAKPSANKRVDAYNAALVALAKQREAQGQHIIHVDAHSAVAISDLNADGIHPKDDAYARIASKWYDGLHNANKNGFFTEPDTDCEAVKCPVAFKA